LALREAREGEELVTRLYQARSDRWAFQPPFSDESFALRKLKEDLPPELQGEDIVEGVVLADQYDQVFDRSVRPYAMCCVILISLRVRSSQTAGHHSFLSSA
jgi:hypothetical protein